MLIRKVFNYFLFYLFFSLTEQQTANNSLKAEVQMLKTSLDELKNLNTTLRDEYTALQLAFSALEDKLRGVQVSFINRYCKMVLHLNNCKSPVMNLFIIYLI